LSFHELNFEFDNRKSTEFPMYIVHIDSGMVSSEISGSRQMIYNKSPYNDNIFYYRTDTETMKFSITVSPLEGIWTEELRFELFRWLYSRQPKAFRSCDFIGKLCYCVCTNALELVNNGNKQGYLNLEFEATSSYWLSDIEISTFDFSDLTIPQTFEIFCKSNVYHPIYNEIVYFPKLLIDMKGTATAITLNNQSDGNRAFGFTSLTQLESLEIDNDRKKIISSLGNNRIGNMLTGHPWFRLVFGKNTISVNAPSIIQIQSQYGIYI